MVCLLASSAVQQSRDVLLKQRMLRTDPDRAAFSAAYARGEAAPAAQWRFGSISLFSSAMRPRRCFASSAVQQPRDVLL